MADSYRVVRQPKTPEDENALIFVGVGSSTGTPRLSCLGQEAVKCGVCKDALLPGSKNRRHNPSALIQYRGKNILIDCGKTFRSSCVNMMAQHHVPELNAVVITHGHADACYGLDDIREYCDDNKSIPVYVHSQDFGVVKQAFPYLVDTSRATGSGYVSAIRFIQFQNEPFEVCGLRITPLMVHHGVNSQCCGFHFLNCVYLSDISGMPAETEELIRAIPEADRSVFIIDALRLKTEVVSHYSMLKALAELRKWKPAKSYFTGMSHEFDYSKHNLELRQQLAHPEVPLDIEIPFEGMKIRLDN